MILKVILSPLIWLFIILIVSCASNPVTKKAIKYDPGYCNYQTVSRYPYQCDDSCMPFQLIVENKQYWDHIRQCEIIDFSVRQ